MVLLFESIIYLDKRKAAKTRNMDSTYFLWKYHWKYIFKGYFLSCRSVRTCSSFCQFSTDCAFLWMRVAFATGDTLTQWMYSSSVFQAFQRDESDFSQRILCGGESQLNWATGTWGQRPDGLGLQCSLLSPCLINKVNTGWGVRLLRVQLLLIGSKHSRSTVQCLPPCCFSGGLDEQGYNGGVGS